MIDNTAGQLHAAIAAVCPIHGVSIGRKDDKATWRIDYAPEATVEQQAAALTVMLNFDVAAAKAESDAKVAREELIAIKMKELAEAMVDDPLLLTRLKASK